MNPRVFLQVADVHIHQSVEIGGEDGHHLVRVLRVQPDETVAFGISGRGYLARVDEVDTKNGVVSTTITEALPDHEPAVKVHLLQGLPKGEKTEFIIQHGTETGVHSFLLVQSERSVLRLNSKDVKQQQNRLMRWQRVIREAAGQSQRDLLPALTYAPTWDDAATWLSDLAPELVLFLDEEEQVESLAGAIFNYTGSMDDLSRRGPIVVCVGPEGGWDSAERTLLIKQFGAIPVTIGPRILRTESAGIVAVAAILYHFHALERVAPDG